MSQCANLSSPLEGERTKQGRRPQQSRGGYDLTHLPHAKSLRKNMTPWEQKLWRQLSSKRLLGNKFRRQQPIGPYIVDFVNFEHKLVIELDGSQHVESIKDQKRDAFLKSTGYTVLRFWNNEVDSAMDSVLDQILTALTPHGVASATPAPPQGGSK